MVLHAENEQVNCLCEAGQGKYGHSLLALLLNWSLLAWLVGRPSFLFSSPPNLRKIMLEGGLIFIVLCCRSMAIWGELIS